jgi:hypothetical protein
MKKIIRNQPITLEEATKNNEIRAQIEKEFPPIKNKPLIYLIISKTNNSEKEILHYAYLNPSKHNFLGASY